MSNKRVVIIGSGLGGLACGLVLARNGYRVTLLERDRQTGGCLQSFRRGETVFDTGFHYVGGLAEGGPLYPLFRYLDLLDLPWQRLDSDCAEEVCIGGERFALPQGHEAFVRQLAARFPQEKEGLQRYIDTLRAVGDSASRLFHPDDAPDERMQALLATSAQRWLCETISDPLLRRVLVGSGLKMELTPDLPLYAFAEIQNSFIHSAHRLAGGGSRIAERLCSRITQQGGEVLLGATVTRILEDRGKVTGVEVNGQDTLSADYVISDAHPAATLALLSEDTTVRPIYRRRIVGLPNSGGMFTCHIRLREGALPYIPHPIYLHTADSDPWQTDGPGVRQLLVHMYPDEPALDLLTPMRYGDVAAWADQPSGRRGSDYEALKEERAQRCIRLAAERLPELPDAIAQHWTSTPLTYAHYTGTPEGSAYGVRKDCRNPLLTFLSPRTPLEGLLLTGQSIHLHGLLGVSMTALLTCREILGDLPDFEQ